MNQKYKYISFRKKDISEDKFRGKYAEFYLNDEREAFVLIKK